MPNDFEELLINLKFSIVEKPELIFRVEKELKDLKQHIVMPKVIITKFGWAEAERKIAVEACKHFKTKGEACIALGLSYTNDQDAYRNGSYKLDRLLKKYGLTWRQIKKEQFA